jgi:hypothetical protein
MTTLSAPVAADSRLLGRAAALLVLASAVVHLLLIDVATLASPAMLGMALVCLPCAWHLWGDATAGVWRLTAGMDAGMLLLHAQMLAPQPGHQHGTPALMWLGLGLVAAQLALAGVAALASLRR